MPPPDFFPPSGWGTILAARDDFAALERLLARYRPPILLEMQSRARCDKAEAEDLTQEFIQVWLRRDFLKRVTPEQGRFRTFVKVCIVNFLRDVHSGQSAQKRGDGKKAESLDATDAEGRRILDLPAEELAPDEAMDRAWAMQVVQEALTALEVECIAARRGSLYTALKPSLAGDPAAETYAAVGARLGMSESAVKVASHRLRQRLGEMVAEEVKQTVGSREDWQEELCYLVALVGK